MHPAQPLLSDASSLISEGAGDEETYVLSPNRARWCASGPREITMLSTQVLRATTRLLDTAKLSTLIWILPEYLQPRGSAPKQKLHPTSYLDALRGYASWIVLNHHLSNHPETWILQQPFFCTLHKGSLMVDIFFIISGYVLSNKALKLMRENKEINLLECLASSTFRRYLRLYFSAGVGALTSMVFIYLNLMVYPLTPRLDSFTAQLWDWVCDMIFFSNPLADVKGWYYEGVFKSRYLHVLWTIPVEFRGSLVVFLFCNASCRLSVTSRLAICWLIILLCYLWEEVYVALFMFGVFLAERSLNLQSTSDINLPPFEHEKPHSSGKRQIGYHMVPITTFAIGILLSTQPDDLGMEGPLPWPYLSRFIPSWWNGGNAALIHFWTSISAYCIVYSVEVYPLFRRPLVTGFSQYLGQLSFGLYVMHYILQPSLYDGLLTPAREAYLGESFWCYCVVYVPYVLAVLWVADYFNRVDRVVISFGRWLEKKMFVQGMGRDL